MSLGVTWRSMWSKHFWRVYSNGSMHRWPSSLRRAPRSCRSVGAGVHLRLDVARQPGAIRPAGHSCRYLHRCARNPGGDGGSSCLDQDLARLQQALILPEASEKKGLYE